MTCTFKVSNLSKKLSYDPSFQEVCFPRMMKNRNKSSYPHRTTKAMSRTHDFNATCLDGGGGGGLTTS